MKLARMVSGTSVCFLCRASLHKRIGFDFVLWVMWFVFPAFSNAACLPILSCFLYAAERNLAEAEKIPGFTLQLLQVVASATSAADGPIRQGAAVQFKNIVKKGWDTNSEVRMTDYGAVQFLSGFRT
jgi:hypothetical protein